MNKILVNVPEKIRYISEWESIINEIPVNGHCIVNKTITGCGFTHYCLTNNIPTILCSPRKFLLENKQEQHSNTLLIINKGEKSLDVDGDDFNVSEKLLKEASIRENSSLLPDNYAEIESIISQVKTYCFNCHIFNQAPKILVTYDSLKHVLSALGDSISFYSIIVDEFQNIFMDSKFKASVELNFLSYLQSCPNVTYLSATPYIDEYLDELDEFKDLPYYELKWDASKLRKIEIDFKKTSTPNKEIDKIIDNYKIGKYPTKYIGSELYQSKEVVFYVNSVRMICLTIKRNKLSPDQVNVICADTPKNKKELEKIGIERGKAPLKGEPHKMFTFCTRTTYVGADFYSTSAWSVIISDCGVDSLATDIRMDFPQIMGRQRLKENVFRDDCLFIYKLSDKDVTMEEFYKLSEEKLKKSSADIQTFQLSKEFKSGNLEEDRLRTSNLLEDLRDRVLKHRYRKDYTGVKETTGELTINKLVYLAEKRAFELRSNTYKNEVTVYNEFESITSNLISNSISEELQNKLDKIREILFNPGRFSNKMEAVCEFLTDPKYQGRISLSDIQGLSREFKNYLYYLGPERIKALGYKEIELQREINNIQSGSLIKEEFSKKFLLGSKYSLKEIKTTISLIYQSLGLTKTPKATDILEYFNIKEVFIYNPSTKKQCRGYEILSLKN